MDRAIKSKCREHESCRGKGHHFDGCCDSDGHRAGAVGEYCDNVILDDLSHPGEMENNDNRKDLLDKFDIVFDETHRRFAAGYQWFCKRCGKPCSSQELWFPCKGRFITLKVVCHLGCMAHWRLKIHTGSNVKGITLH